jgi:hypothetical protein
VKGAATLVFLTIIALAIVFGGALLFSMFNVSAEIGLPILSIAGVLLLLGTLALVAVAFVGFDLQDRTQALGLPEGSIRAVIALSLILLFAILAIYLFNAISTRDTMMLSGLTRAERDSFVAELPKDRIIGIAPVAPAADGEATYDISLLVPRDPATDGFAKELLILLGTLVTSIASFYFGTKATAGATGAGERSPAAAPKIDRLQPNALKLGAAAALFNATGSGLADVKGVNAVSGTEQIAATDVVASDKSLAFKLAIPAGKPVGAWDIMLVDSGGAAIKAAMLNVTA